MVGECGRKYIVRLFGVSKVLGVDPFFRENEDGRTVAEVCGMNDAPDYYVLQDGRPVLCIYTGTSASEKARMQLLEQITLSA